MQLPPVSVGGFPTGCRSCSRGDCDGPGFVTSPPEPCSVRSNPAQTGELLGFQVAPQAILARSSFPQTKQNWETRTKCPAHSRCSVLFINLHFPSHRDRNKTPTSSPALSASGPVLSLTQGVLTSSRRRSLRPTISPALKAPHGVFATQVFIE